MSSETNTWYAFAFGGRAVGVVAKVRVGVTSGRIRRFGELGTGTAQPCSFGSGALEPMLVNDLV